MREATLVSFAQKINKFPFYPLQSWQDKKDAYFRKKWTRICNFDQTISSTYCITAALYYSNINWHFCKIIRVHTKKGVTWEFCFQNFATIYHIFIITILFCFELKEAYWVVWILFSFPTKKYEVKRISRSGIFRIYMSALRSGSYKMNKNTIVSFSSSPV